MSGMRIRWMLPSIAMAVVLVGCSTSSPPVSVSVSAASPQTLDQSLSLTVTATVSNDAAGEGVTWTLQGPGSLKPAGLMVTYVSPAAAIANPEQTTVTATSVADSTKSASLTITVNPYPVVSGLALPTGTVGVPYNQSIVVTGGSPPFRWSVYDGPILTGWQISGSLPEGLTLDSTTGTISGTPTAPGTWYFDPAVVDADNLQAATLALKIQINPAASASAGNPVPFVNEPLVPTAVAPGGPGLSLTVSGTGFVSGATVNFDGKPLNTTFVDSQHLTALVPASAVAVAQTASVAVVNPPPGGGASNSVEFGVGAPSATVTFAEAPNSPLQILDSMGTVIDPTALAIADFNQDGKPDLAIAGSSEIVGLLCVMLGNGDGTFAPASGSPLRLPSPPYNYGVSPYTAPALAVGDFNYSGHPGLAVGLFENQAAVILFGNGNGTFSYSSTPAQIGTFPMSLVAADFNQDGNLDLFADGVYGPDILLGYNDGAFNALLLANLAGANSAAAGDFNGDGKLDIATGPSVLLGDGSGGFTQQSLPDPSAEQVVAGDFNGDGKLDLAVTDFEKNTVTILLGDGYGGFAIAPGSPISVGSDPSALVAGDFNGDGKLDLAVANNPDSTVTLLLGNGDGTFTQASGSPWPVATDPTQIVAADFNGDGKLDLAVLNGTGVSILLQQ
jgi:hypothetical protein